MPAPATGFSHVVLAEVGSTNLHALDHADRGASDRTWIVANRQTGGRGRHGRRWESPPGNLYATLLLNDPCPVAVSPQLGFVAGVALADAVRGVCPQLNCALKWPNDLLASEPGASRWAKLSGILLEGRLLADGRQAVAIGIGVNVRHAPQIEGRVVGALADFGCGADRDAVFDALAQAFGHWLQVFARGEGFPAIRAAWRQRAFPSGTRMSVKLPAGEQAGRFAGIDAQGRLALDTAGGLVHVDAGDVFLTPGE